MTTYTRINFQVFIGMILVNLIVPVATLNQIITHPEIQLSSDPRWLIFISLGHLLNISVCSLLGEETYGEGFKAMLWSILLSYISFVVLLAGYLRGLLHHRLMIHEVQGEDHKERK